MKRLSSVVYSTWWTIWNLDEQCMSVILSYLELFIHSWGLIELTQGQRFLHVTMLRCSWQFSNSVPLHGSEADTRKTWQWQFHVRSTICTCIVYAFLIIFRWFASPNAIIFMNWSAPSTLLPVSRLAGGDVAGVIRELPPYMGGIWWHLRNHLDVARNPSGSSRWLLCLLGKGKVSQKRQKSNSFTLSCKSWWNYNSCLVARGHRDCK